MDTQGSAGVVSVPAMVQQALTRADRDLAEAQRARASSPCATARKMARIAELYERQARWWDVLSRWTYGGSELPRVFGTATLAASNRAKSLARQYRELESRYWQRALAVAADSGVAA